MLLAPYHGDWPYPPNNHGLALVLQEFLTKGVTQKRIVVWTTYQDKTDEINPLPYLFLVGRIIALVSAQGLLLGLCLWGVSNEEFLGILLGISSLSILYYNFNAGCFLQCPTCNLWWSYLSQEQIPLMQTRLPIQFWEEV